MEAALRLLKIVRGVMLASIVLYAWYADRYGPPPQATNPAVFYAISALAVSIIAIVLVVHLVFIPRRAAILAAQPDDRVVLARWQMLHILVYALCESVALYGLVLRFLGFTFLHVSAFYLAGFVLMLFIPPKQPTSATGIATSASRSSF